jgi:hypothetical protein
LASLYPVLSEEEVDMQCLLLIEDEHLTSMGTPRHLFLHCCKLHHYSPYLAKTKCGLRKIQQEHDTTTTTNNTTTRHFPELTSRINDPGIKLGTRLKILAAIKHFPREKHPEFYYE